MAKQPKGAPPKHKKATLKVQPKPPGKKRGPKPGSKRKPERIIKGYEMPARAKALIEKKYGALQKELDTFGGLVADFVYNLNAEAGYKATKMTVAIIGEIKSFKKDIRSAREALKPIYEEVPPQQQS
jgi:hypothetical protein